MEDIYTSFEKEDKDDIDVNDDKRIEVINRMKDDKEIEAAKQVVLEEIKEPEKDTSLNQTFKEPTPTKDEKVKGTSEEAKAKVEQATNTEQDRNLTTPEGTGGQAGKAGTAGKDKPAEDFVLTEEKINSYPEEFRGILSKYKGKTKAELEKAIANAVIFKTDQDVIKALIETQKETGKAKQPEQPLKATEFSRPEELFPLSEDNDEVKRVITAEATKRLRYKYHDIPDDLNSEEGKNWLSEVALKQLKAKYPNLPADPSSDEYHEFMRDLQDEDLEKANEFLYEKRRAIEDVRNEFNSASSQVKKDLQQLIYVQKNYKAINNTRLEAEINSIKSELDQLGISEKDLGLDFKLEKDENGVYYNEHLSPLLLNGEYADSDIVNYIGQYPILKPGRLKGKFLYANNMKILNLLSRKRVQDVQKETARLRDTNLNSLGGSHSSGTPGNALTLDQIEKTNDESALKREKNRLEALLGS